MRKSCFAGFETGFTSFVVPLSGLWWLFCVNQMYRCQDTDKNVAMLSLKFVLRHSSFFFEHFGGYFASIRRSVAKIRAKTLIRWLWNWFYGISRSYLSTLVEILRFLDLPLPKFKKNRSFIAFETGSTALAIRFWAFWWLFCVNLMYCCQDTCENVASPALKLDWRYSLFFFALWGLFCVNQI